MGKVYQVQASTRLDVRPALEYGGLEVLIDQVAEPALAPVPLVRGLRHALRNFSDEDYLLPTGSPAAIAAAAMVAGQANGGRVKMLLWDRERRRYYETQLEV